MTIVFDVSTQTYTFFTQVSSLRKKGITLN